MKLKKFLRKLLQPFENGIIIYIFLKILIFFIQITPIFLCEKIIKILGNFAFFTMKGHRRLALKNIDIAFGDKYTKYQKIKMCKRVFEEIMSYLEIFQIYKFKEEQLMKMTKIEGEEILKEVLKEKKGVVAVSGHFGNFPFALMILNKKGYPINPIVANSVNVYTDRDIRKLREKYNVPAIPRGDFKKLLKETQKWLKNGGILCIYLDQHTPNGIECEFFNRKVYVPSGAAIFARKYKTKVIGMYTIRTGFMKNKIIIEGPYKIKETKNISEDIRENTAFFIKKIQEWVEKYPEQWSSWLNPERFPD
ncbi:MAG: lysophospholipid acyltransferase family protein [Candidatus Omnitrophica bacterium]|nr:lysophospholipid acyltransferase family protein [Candidatus Omnitrophota bacterium]